MRLDKYLWCIRFFKTRSIATTACKKGQVKIDGTNLKPSKDIFGGELIVVRKNQINYQIKVLDLGESDYVERELLLVKFSHGSVNTEVIKALNGEIIFENNELLNIQFVGTSKELDQVLKDLESSNPLEIVRTGASGISSNLKTLTI